MSIIQTIRDKGSAIVIGIIALSLIGFLLMDASSGASKGLFGSNSSTIGKINGDEIEVRDFNERVANMEQQYPAGSGYSRQQIMQDVWDQSIAEKVVNSEFKKLGLTFTAPEMSATILSQDAPQQLKQAFTNSETGQYDIEKARQWLLEMKKSKNQEQRNAVNQQVIDPMELNSMYTKYTSMIAGSVYLPAWLTKKENEANNSFAEISYVAIPYKDISDSAVSVSDKEVEDYVAKNKIRYKQEAGRTISYVTFSAAPTLKDSNATREQLLTQKENFSADTNAKAFVARNVSAINYFDGYRTKAKITSGEKDSIASLPEGAIMGPYLDGADYVLAKKVSTKILPDSIKCRHILLGTVDPQTSQPIMADSVAKQKIDSIETAIKNGADFNTLEAQYSTDKVAHKDNGVMTFDLDAIQGENFAKEFGDFLLNENGETKKTVHTQFGWHYIEILEKKNPQPAYKVAYLAREIVPSEETINAANAAATKLAGESRTEKDFNANIKKPEFSKSIITPPAVKENDYMLGGLQDARQIIKWAFDAKQGDVSEPFSLKDEFVVAAVSGISKEGTPDAKTAKPQVETFIRNQKKSEQIIKKLNNPSSLDAAASAFQKSVLTSGQDSTLTFSAFIINGVGNEPKVAGAAFDKTNQTKVSAPIPGNTGVFVIKVNSIKSKPDGDSTALTEMKTTRIMEIIQGNQQMQKPGALGSSFNALKKMADIKDNRSKFF